MFFNYFERSGILIFTRRKELPRIFEGWKISLQGAFRVYCTKDMDEWWVAWRVNRWKSARFAIPKRMHSNGYDRILSRRGFPYAHFFSNVLLDKFIFFRVDEWEIISFGEDSQYLRIQLSGETQPIVKRVSNKKEINSNIERGFVFVLGEITGNFIVNSSSKTMILGRSWLKNRFTFITRHYLMRWTSNYKNSSHFTYQKASHFLGR